MDRIDNMLEDVRYLPAHEFENIEQYLKDKITLPRYQGGGDSAPGPAL